MKIVLGTVLVLRAYRSTILMNTSLMSKYSTKVRTRLADARARPRVFQNPRHCTAAPSFPPSVRAEASLQLLRSQRRFRCRRTNELRSRDALISPPIVIVCVLQVWCVGGVSCCRGVSNNNKNIRDPILEGPFICLP